MADYSLVILVGRLTRDPELKYGANGGLPYTRIGVAVNRQTAQPDGTVKKSVSFIDVTVWKHQAELCCQHLKKGSTCMVVGSLQQGRWTGKDGTAQSKLQVNADRVQFLDRRIEVPVPLPAGVPANGSSGDETDAASQEGDGME